MISTGTRLRYLADSARKYCTRSRLTCPDCGSSGRVVDRKMLVTQLRRCGSCNLLYRAPTTAAQKMDQFHRTSYRQGSITDLPTSEGLQSLIESNFAGGPLSYQRFIEALDRLGISAPSRLYEFGCSWGYGAWQFASAGYECFCWDIDERRLAFAQDQLGVRVRAVAEIEEASLDVFFSSHVIEHVPRARDMIETARHLLRAGGIFLNATPNGTETFRKAFPKIAHKIWGLVHPQLIDETYLQTVVDSSDELIVTTDLQELRLESLSGQQCVIGDLTGDELVFVVRKR